MFYKNYDIDTEKIETYRVEDFYLKKIDTKVLIFFGFNTDGKNFIIIVPEEQQSTDVGDYETLPFFFEKRNFDSRFNRITFGFLLELFEDKGLYKPHYGRRDTHPWEEVEKENKKVYQYAIIRRKRMLSIVKTRLIHLWKTYYGFTEEDIKDIFFLMRRLRVSKYINLSKINVLKKNFTDEQYNYFISDMKKLPVGYAMYVLKDFIESEDITFENYLNTLKNTPKFIKNCKYQFLFIDSEIEFFRKHKLSTPKNRLQYYYLYALISQPYGYPANLVEFLQKMQHIDKETWHTFKEYMHIKGPYNVMELRHIMTTITDGANIHYRYKGKDTYGIKFVKVKGSPKKMLQRAIFNHRQQQEYNKKKALEEENKPMPLPPVTLPEWIEGIRMKTKHELIIAGIDCQHCIGSYTNSNDIFVREGDVCAQISRRNLQVYQCYDSHDKITEASQELKSRLEKALAPIAEKNHMREPTTY